MLEFNATLLVAMVSFTIFIVIMNAIFYKPIYEIINKRKAYVDETLDAAKNSKQQAEAILLDKQQKLEENKRETRDIIRNSTDEANIKANQLLEDAKLNSKIRMSDAKASLINQSEFVEKTLADKSETLSDNIMAKVLGDV